MTYAADERRRAEAWKARTAALPDAARAPAPYLGRDGRTGGRSHAFCLPREHAEHNLLPEVRADVLALFAAEGIPWHASVDGGPSNHLLSSQVQCANALGQMVHDPSRAVHAFGELLGIAEVLEVEPGRTLTFELIGPQDLLGEGAHRTRGARCTSVDAAFLHRRHDGVRELVLVEWKYTESYGPRPDQPEADVVRWSRYGALLSSDDSPVRADLLPPARLLDEPLYQLVRQQLLAAELERTRAYGADVVRVLHVLPPGNVAYQQSLHRPEHRALGATVGEVWRRLLARPDRFTSVDPALLCDPRVTSHEYVARYAA